MFDHAFFVCVALNPLLFSHKLHNSFGKVCKKVSHNSNSLRLAINFDDNYLVYLKLVCNFENVTALNTVNMWFL